MTGIEPQAPSSRVLAQAVARIARADYPAWTAALATSGYCTRPVRLIGSLTRTDPGTGEIVDHYTTAQEPGGVLLKACNNRRVTRCPACAAVYQSDARALVLAGLIGGKGQPDTVAERPVVFATLTAPSFGAVHTLHDNSGPCQHPNTRPCSHLQRCTTTHPAGDPLVGTPICDDCYDWAGTVIFNARATELWRRTIINIRRSLAGSLGMSVRAFPDRHTVAFVKIVEYQTRGVVHYHALLRLDPVRPTLPVDVDASMLAAAVRVAVGRVTAPNPHQPEQPTRWGAQADIVAVPTGPDRARLAGYFAKYTTKSVDDGGGLDRRLTHGDLSHSTAPEHLRRLAATTWDLGTQPALAPLNLQYWAHTLGYRGHWLTKSQTWSTTLTQLRTDRHHHQLAAHGHNPNTDPTIAHGQWQYRGNGHTNDGDTWLAQTAANNHQRNRRTAWEEQ
jgi:hypothetical protein